MSEAELLDIAVECARTAGALLLERFGSERVLATKSTSTDLVSAADLAAEEAIRGILARRAPDDAIMGEEGDDTPGTSGRRWVVDPLDGTVNYLYGLPQWCVSIACEGAGGGGLRPDARRAVHGDGERAGGVQWHCLEPVAAGGPGARAGGDRLRLRRAPPRAAGRGRRARDPAPRATSAAAAPRPSTSRWTAAGRLDAYYERGVNLWDVAAGELICARAGLTVTRLEPSGDLPWGTCVARALDRAGPAGAGRLGAGARRGG